ncbi:amino acid permease [Salmonella enterica subsp. enterica serovar Virchow]|nr:amino acid permease [Salmonella enterica subsp. enterica serovar Virchow]
MKTQTTHAAEQHAAKRRWLNAHEEGYHKAMGNRQVQMIAIGGAIGTGLFLGAGARLQMAGPALALVYLICGIFSFFILRALGELVLHRPSSGSFVSYAREFLGEKAAYVAGWMYFINWAMTGIVDITAVALYMHYWGAFGDVPQWVFALGALTIIGSIMNIVVLTAALSSLNSGLYCTGRILRSMSMGGSAPKFMAKMSRQHVPYAGILATLVVYVVGVFLNYLVPSRVFEIVLNFASLGIIASWAFIMVCQMRLRQAIKEGKAADVSFKLPGAPFTSWLTLLFLLSVLVLMAFDYPNGTYTIASLPLIAILLVAGWFGVRRRVAEIHRTAPVTADSTESVVLKEEAAT